MKCKEVKKHLNAYIDDRLDETVRSKMDAHVRECPDCRREYDALTALTTGLRNEPAVRAPDDFARRLRRKLDSRGSGVKRLCNALSAPFGFKIPFGFATATAVAVAVLVVIQMKHPEAPKMPDGGAQLESGERTGDFFSTKKQAVESPPAPGALESTAPSVKPLPDSRTADRPETITVTEAKPRPAKEPNLADATTPTMENEPDGPTIRRWALTVDSAGDAQGGKETFQPGGRAELRSGAAMEERLNTMAAEESREKTKEGASVEGENARERRLILDAAVLKIEAAAVQFGGSVVSVKQTRHTDPECFLTIRIPGPALGDFYASLADLGRFDDQKEEPVWSGAEMVTIHLTMDAK